MALPIEMARKLARLDRSRRQLVRSGDDLYALNARVLRNGTAEFVASLAKNGPDCLAENIGRPMAGLKVLWETKERIRRAGSEVLSQLHQAINPNPSQSMYRTEQIAPFWPGHAPLEPELVPGALGRFFEWVQAEGFREMHPVEQMTLCQIRLCEILPFEVCSVQLAITFSWSFLLEDRYLVPSYGIDQRSTFDEAMSQAFKFSTLELLALNLDACQRSYPDALTALE